MKFAVLGNSGNRRVRMFAQAVLKAGHPQPLVLSWRDYLAGRLDLAGSLAPGTILRIDSPGEDPMTDLLLLERVGIKLRIGDIAWGEIRYGKEWFRSFSEVLQGLEKILESTSIQGVYNTPAAIRTMYDKWQTHDVLAKAGIPQPNRLGKVESFMQLLTMMDVQGLQQVFVKPLHGSSASGVIALRKNGDSISATTSVEMTGEGDDLKLFNSLQIRKYRDPSQLEQLINRLCAEELLAEEWIPKLGFEEATIDLRVVVIAGKARQVVLRASQSPLTNLHLGNRRGNLEAFRKEIGESRWKRYMEIAEEAVAAIPGAYCAGVDLLVATDPDLVYIGEVNAFGDLLPQVLFEGENTYASWVSSFRN